MPEDVKSSFGRRLSFFPKRADIGVAMGRQSSDVAKEAAEIILIDDDFTTLGNSVREGRTIFQNLTSVILSSILSNIGELSCVCIGFVGAAFVAKVNHRGADPIHRNVASDGAYIRSGRAEDDAAAAS